MLKSLVSGIKLYLDKRLKEQRDETDERIANQKWHETTVTPLFSETVTTVAEGTTNVATLSYAEPITADTLKVTFNGVEYTCTKRTIEGSTSVEYGAPLNVDTDEYDFSEYPFNILSSDMGGNNEIATETADTYTVSASTESTTYTESFVKGVNTVAGWKEETSTPLFNESVTTVTEGDYATANLAYSEEITSDVLSVVFNGTEYTCYRREGGGYGGAYNEADDTYDFSEYPFTIETSMSSNDIFTAEPGTYNISASAENITYTDAFKKGVAENSTFYVDFKDGDNGLVCNKTIPEIATAYESGVNVVGRYDGKIYCYSNATYTFSRTLIDVPNDEVVINQIVLIDTPTVKTIELYEGRVSATIEKISGGGSSPIG